MRRMIVCAAAVSFCLPAVAQTKVCMGGKLDQLSSAERNSCENQVRMVQSSKAGLNAPGGWHFVVVCGEDGWKDYAAFSQQGKAQLADIASDTDFASKTTFIRGTRLKTAEAAELVVAQSLQHPAGELTQIAMK